MPEVHHGRPIGTSAFVLCQPCLRRSQGQRDSRIEQAFRAVKREPFVGPGPWLITLGAHDYVETPNDDPAFIYQNTLVALDSAQHLNIGMPSAHAYWLDACELKEGETVLQVGVGTGYYTAILAQLVGPSGQVHAYEIDESLADRARDNLKGLPQANVQARSGISPDSANSGSDLRLCRRGPTSQGVARCAASRWPAVVSACARQACWEGCCWSNVPIRARFGRRSSLAGHSSSAVSVFRTRMRAVVWTEAFLARLGTGAVTAGSITPSMIPAGLRAMAGGFRRQKPTLRASIDPRLHLPHHAGSTSGRIPVHRDSISLRSLRLHRCSAGNQSAPGRDHQPCARRHRAG